MTEQTDSEKRARHMTRSCVASVMIALLSLVCIIVGALAIAESAPTYTFPYCLGGALIAGVMSVLSSCCVMCVYCEYTGMTNDSVKSWVYCMAVMISFVVISLMLGVGMSGIWGMTQTSDRINVEQMLNRKSYDTEYELSNRNYAIASFVLVFILTILHIVAWCHCYKFLNTYGFGDRSYTYRYRNRYRPSPRHEQLLSIQHRTRENRSRGVPYTIPIPEIYHGTTHSNQASDSQNADHDGRFLYTESSRQLPSYNHVVSSDGAGGIGAEERPQTDRPPPPYDELEKSELPSYTEVVTEGHYISTGFTEFVTKI